jgi:hypothetical protein
MFDRSGCRENPRVPASIEKSHIPRKLREAFGGKDFSRRDAEIRLQVVSKPGLAPERCEICIFKCAGAGFEM